MLLHSTRRLPRGQLAGFWDDNMDVPTIYLDPVDTGAGDTSIYDARDAMAQGTATVPDIVTSAAGGSSGSSLSLSDILKAGTSVVQAITSYKATTLPNGSRIYTRIDPRTGLPVYGGGNVTLPANSVSGFIQNNLPLLALFGVGLVALISEG